MGPSGKVSTEITLASLHWLRGRGRDSRQWGLFLHPIGVMPRPGLRRRVPGRRPALTFPPLVPPLSARRGAGFGVNAAPQDRGRPVRGVQPGRDRLQPGVSQRLDVLKRVSWRRLAEKADWRIAGGGGSPRVVDLAQGLGLPPRGAALAAAGSGPEEEQKGQSISEIDNPLRRSPRPAALRCTGAVRGSEGAGCCLDSSCRAFGLVGVVPGRECKAPRRERGVVAIALRVFGRGDSPQIDGGAKPRRGAGEVRLWRRHHWLPGRPWPLLGSRKA
jgi:hypothetical protein